MKQRLLHHTRPSQPEKQGAVRSCQEDQATSSTMSQLKGQLFAETSLVCRVDSYNVWPIIIESWHALGWKGPLEVIWPDPPAVSRDIFN